MIVPQPSSSPRLADKLTVPGLCVLLVMLVFLVFSRVCGYGFVGFDDDNYFYSNFHVKTGLTWAGVRWAFQTGYASNWHPLTWLSLMLDAQMFGSGPAGPHFTNLFLHAINSVLLFLLFRRLTAATWSSLFVAALFAIHPLRVESVAWVSERKDVLSGLFFLLTLDMYARYARRSKAGVAKSKFLYVGSLLLFACGLMSKPMLVTLPFVLLLLDYWPLNRFECSRLKPLLVEKLPFLSLSIASCAVTVWAQQQAIKPMVLLPQGVRIGNALISYVIYLAQMFWPENLVVYYPYQIDRPAWQIPGAAALLFCLTMLAILTARRFPYFRMGWLWYLGMLVPAIGLVQVGGQAHADRYMYLPQIGLTIAIVWAIRDWSQSWRYRRQILVPLAMVVIGVLMVSTWKQTAYWRTDEVLWKRALACTSGNYVAYNNLGVVLAHEGRVAEARENYRQAIKYYPDYAEANVNLGVTYMNGGRLAEAERCFQRAIEINPNVAEAYNNLGLVFAKLGRTDEAIEQYRKAVQLNPDRLEIYNNLGNLLARQGRPAEAVEQFQKALEVAPGNAKIHYNLALVLAAQGRTDEAITNFEQALKQMPDSIHGHYQLGILLQERGKFAAAADQFQKILELDPGHIPAQNNLA